MKPPERRVLLTPGPATTSEAVKLAQVVPDICPREEEFAGMVRTIAVDLARVMEAPADARAILLAGSGTAAVEAMLGSFAAAGVLVVNNGAYGERMLRVAAAHGIPALEFQSSPEQALDLAALDAALAGRPAATAYLALVQHETTTGLLNDLAAVGDVARRHGVRLLVDAVSAYAALPIDMEGMNVAALASTANKNLQGMAGVGFVIARGAEIAAARMRPRRGFYLDAVAEHDYFLAHGQMRFTAPVQTLYALRKALDETLAEGVAARLQRYRRCWQALIDGMEARGFRAVVPRPLQGGLITAFEAGAVEGFDFDRVHDFLLARGVTIYPGKLPGRETFRVANIGAIVPQDIHAFLGLLDECLAARA